MCSDACDVVDKLCLYGCGYTGVVEIFVWVVVQWWCRGVYMVVFVLVV